MAGEADPCPVEILPEVQEPAPRRKRKSKSASLSAAVDATIVGVFNLTAVVTSHRHWLKDAEDVKPITEPINAWMDQLPLKQLKAFEERICPILLGVGLATVLVPDIVLEARLRASHRRSARFEAGGAEATHPSGSSPGGSAGWGSAHGNGRSSGAGEGARVSDPSIPPPIPGIGI